MRSVYLISPYGPNVSRPKELEGTKEGMDVCTEMHTTAGS